MKKLFNWTYVAPFLTLILALTGLIGSAGVFYWFAIILLISCVMASVHHAEVVAHRVGEPFGTIVLALAGGASYFGNIIDVDTDSVTRALDRYEGLAESGLLANRLDFDTFMRVFDEKVELPFGYGLGMTQNFLPDFQARRVKYVDKPAVAFWSNDNLMVFLLLELGLGAFIYLFIVFAVNLSLYSRFVNLLRWRQVSGFTILAACCVTCFVLTIFNWGAVALPFNPESFFFWFWVAMGFNTFKAVKFEKMT